MTRKPKIYAAVFNDDRHAFYSSWSECHLAVNGVAGVKHKCFKTKAEAKNWIERTLGSEKPYSTDAHNQQHSVFNKKIPASIWPAQERSIGTKSFLPSSSSINSPFWNKTRRKRVIDH